MTEQFKQFLCEKADTGYIVKNGIFVDKDVDELTKRVNELHPAGTDNGWVVSKDKEFRQGKPNPYVCEQDASRKHYLFNC